MHACRSTLEDPTSARRIILAVTFAVLGTAWPVHAQRSVAPLYRVFLADGTALASFGEWARLDDRLVFSMPLTAGPDPSQLHLVSIPAERVDWTRTERYADAVRGAQYAATRGEADFARLSAEVARVLNQVAILEDPRQRMQTAERARQALADWPGTHYGYRASEVSEILGILDEVISGLRASAGLGRYELALAATTPPPPAETLLPPPEQSDVVQQLMTAATLADTPAEKLSLLQTVVGVLDRAVDLLPSDWAATIRTRALGSIVEEQKTDAAYGKMRSVILADAVKRVDRADIRGLERLRRRVQEQDDKLGHRRPAEVMALLSAIDAHLDAAHRLRLAHDQWLLRVDRMRAYQRTAARSVGALTGAADSLGDIRSLAGPTPNRLRVLADQLAREGRQLARVDPPEELVAVHALFRSACELAENAVRLRLDAAVAADMERARQASSAAAGALMLLARAKADLDTALRPPTAQGTPAAQP